MKWTFLLTLGLLIITLSGCATLFTGTRDDIFIKSDPAGATIYVDDEEVGQTPALVRVRRTLGQRWLTLELEGYETEHMQLLKTFNAASVVNLLGGFAFWMVDLASGAIVRYEDKTIETTLEPALPLPKR